jgi:hypothetical protein
MKCTTWAVVLAACTAVGAASPTGIWEANGLHSQGHARHWVLRLDADGTFRRTELSDDPLWPVREEAGTFSVEGRRVRLAPASSLRIGSGEYELSMGGDTLVWRQPTAISMLPGRQVDPESMLGTWRLFLGEVRTGAWIRLSADGTYDVDLVGSTEHGPYRLVGSGMVHWPTEASDPDMLGVPGVWTGVRVEGDTLYYTIPSGAVIRGERQRETVVTETSWASIKRQLADR